MYISYLIFIDFRIALKIDMEVLFIISLSDLESAAALIRGTLEVAAVLLFLLGTLSFPSMNLLLNLA